MFKTIFQRFFWTSTAIILFTVAVVSVSMMGLLNRYVEDERYFSAKKTAAAIEYFTLEFKNESYTPWGFEKYRDTLDVMSKFVDADIVIVNSVGEVFATNHTENKSLTPPTKYVGKVLDGEAVAGRVGTRKSNHIIGMPIRERGEAVAGMFFFFPPGVGESTVERFSTTLFYTLVIAVVLSLILIFLEARHVSKPLKQINSAVLEIASGKFDKRVSVSSKGEVAQLASSFNYMADSLEHLEEMRQSFVSDISHELRTPMTSISGFVQGILDGTIPKDKEKEYLEIVLDESTRLAKLTNDMFEMTKMNSPGYKLSVSKFDVNEVIRRCIISLEKKLEAKELELSVDFENDAENVLADPDSIKRVILNLLDNAVKFSYPKNTIEIKVHESGKKVCVDIVNYGVGIAKEDIPHIFDRFYKSDKSRGREKTGAGLGLSFVKNILSLHSQTVTAKCEPQDENKTKTVFSFTLEKA